MGRDGINRAIGNFHHGSDRDGERYLDRGVPTLVPRT
jgi:hypothetical protein